MTPQGDQGLRTSSQVTQGGTITIDVGATDQTVQVSEGGPEVLSFPVGPDRIARFPVPDVPGGTVLMISCGRGLRARIVLVEVIAP